MVRDFQSIIGRETRKQILKLEGRLPDYLVACVGGGSNAMGLFHAFFKDKKVRFIGVEAGGFGLNTTRYAATLNKGKIGVLHGSKSLVLQTNDGQIAIAHSIAAGLDYPGVGPEHSYYKKIKRAQYVSVTDSQALEGFKLLSEAEGIIPALEPAHALYYLKVLSKKTRSKKLVVLCLSGRGDKDISIVREYFKL
jgi:tryptophan synthase beta chain